MGLDQATPLLVGLAFGAYGVTQEIRAVPFGMLSDRIGRKPVIMGGLCFCPGKCNGGSHRFSLLDDCRTFSSGSRCGKFCDLRPDCGFDQA